MEKIEIPCGHGVHFVFGENGQGKTALLEAIYLLSNLKSFRENDHGAMVRMGERLSQVKGEFLIDSTTRADLKVEISLEPRLQKRAYINGKLSKSAADYFGLKLNHSPIQFHAITLNPTSTDLIRGEPSLRRNYLNQSIASESPVHLSLLRKYQKFLDQKNALLKQEGSFELELLQILNDNLAQLGAQIVWDRLKYLSKITAPIDQFLSQIAPGQKKTRIAYFTKIFKGNYQPQPVYFTGQFEQPTLNFLIELYH